jgi:hypothetical protein
MPPTIALRMTTVARLFRGRVSRAALTSSRPVPLVLRTTSSPSLVHSAATRTLAADSRTPRAGLTPGLTTVAEKAEIFDSAAADAASAKIAPLSV